MKKNKLYILFAVLTIIFLFSFAALCNQCGAQTEDKVDIGEEEGSESGETIEDEEQRKMGPKKKTQEALNPVMQMVKKTKKKRKKLKEKKKHLPSVLRYMKVQYIHPEMHVVITG